ncbi:MAG: hypothetical protein ACRDO8_14480 [Nocardioidaceae bacterium]
MVAKGMCRAHYDQDRRTSQPTSPPKDAYLDEAAIWRRMHGDHAVPLTTAEKTELLRRITTNGLSVTTAADITGLSKPERYYQHRHAS